MADANAQEPPVKQQPPQPGISSVPKKWWEQLATFLPQFTAWAAGIAIAALGFGIIILLVGGLYGRTPIVRELASIDYARGVITFIFAIGTIGIALLLTIGALLGNHPEQVFAKAKEVLTVLIGVFGTILGFYFGTSSNEDQRKPTIGPPTIQSTAEGKSATLHAFIYGGDAPYLYKIDFEKEGLNDIQQKSSVDGWIRETIDTSNLGLEPSGYTIAITDARKRFTEYQAKNNERLTAKAITNSSLAVKK